MINVLIVDDEKDICKTIEMRLMASYDCHVDIALEVETAIKLAKENSYDIVFFDYLFCNTEEEQDGFSFLYDLKRRGEKIITVMISGFLESMAEVVSKSSGVAPHEFIPKPFPDGSIMAIMEKYFSNEMKKN